MMEMGSMNFPCKQRDIKARNWGWDDLGIPLGSDCAHHGFTSGSLS